VNTLYRCVPRCRPTTVPEIRLVADQARGNRTAQWWVTLAHSGGTICTATLSRRTGVRHQVVGSDPEYRQDVNAGAAAQARLVSSHRSARSCSSSRQAFSWVGSYILAFASHVALSGWHLPPPGSAEATCPAHRGSLLPQWIGLLCQRWPMMAQLRMMLDHVRRSGVSKRCSDSYANRSG
jgi:hypothetical protein